MITVDTIKTISSYDNLTRLFNEMWCRFDDYYYRGGKNKPSKDEIDAFNYLRYKIARINEDRKCDRGLAADVYSSGIVRARSRYDRYGVEYKSMKYGSMWYVISYDEQTDTYTLRGFGGFAATRQYMKSFLS